MTISVERITATQAAKIMATEEGQFSDVKSVDIAPAKLSKTISAFTNSDGGDLYIGIEEGGLSKQRHWRGFADQEAANGHLQLFEELFPLGTGFEYAFLRADTYPGLVLHVQIAKTLQVISASDGTAYIRRGAQSLPVTTKEALRRLEFAKALHRLRTNSSMCPSTL
jgi:ATP-dependent DNA helicase RecG